MSFPQIARRRLSAEIADHIEQQILNGELAEGSRLPSEKELGLSFGVSRNAVREALKTLEERGLVQIQNGRGAYVTSPGADMLRAAVARYVQSHLTADTVHEFYQFREALEGAAARIASERAGEHDLQLLAAALATMERSEESAAGWMEADVAFHRALLGATHNPFFIALLEPVVDRLREAITASFDSEGAKTGLACHAAILDGIARKDPVATYEAMMATLNDSAGRVTRVLRQERRGEI